MSRNRDKMPFLKGYPGESIFTQPISTIMSTFESNETFPPMLAKLQAAGDDRSLVLTTALLCEYYLDALLDAYFPKYKILQDRKEVTFSLKIDILKALTIIPGHILSCVDQIRQARNEFAHDVEVDSLDKLSESRKAAIRQKAIEVWGHLTPETKKTANIHGWLHEVTLTALAGLKSYAVNAKALSKLIYEPGLERSLADSAWEQDNAHYNEIIKKGPIDEWTEPGQLIQVYEHGIMVVTGMANPHDSENPAGETV